jgi:hypothetical protein
MASTGNPADMREAKGVKMAQHCGRSRPRLLARVEVVVAALAIVGALYFLVDALRDRSWSALWWLFLLGFAAYAIRDRVRSRRRR